jgi:hypothetical protein
MKFLEPFFDMGIEDNFLCLEVLKAGMNLLEPWSQRLNVIRRTKTYHAGRMAIHSMTDEVFEGSDLQIESFGHSTGES